ncbi:hypothetical protein ACNF30_13640, partial [Staphylococcus aureus]|uniref:hypothetical protein n=1 Tax=Staphylococcus aureus TaxID=1280 RepID=UPI003A8102A9
PTGDFLSSLEVVLLHQADVLYMQNWDHVDFILKHTNNLPVGSHDTDFSRVRPYFLDGKGAVPPVVLKSHAACLTVGVLPEQRLDLRLHE